MNAYISNINLFSDNNLKKFIYTEKIDEIGIAIINLDNWIQPESDEEMSNTTKFIVNQFSNALQISKSVGKEYFNVKIYFEKFKVKSINYKFAKYLSLILKELFKDKLGKAILLDPPLLFINAYDILKTLLDKKTRTKIELISTKDKHLLYEDIVK